MTRPLEPSTLPEATVPGRIHLTGLTFHGRVGWYRRERERPRPVEVDLTVAVDLARPAASDQLADTVDYDALAETVRGVVEGSSFRLIERLAGALAEALLAGHPVDAVEVTVHKPAPDVLGQPTAAAVTLYRTRT